MSTLTTAVTLICVVVHQVGVVRNLPSDQLNLYPNSIVFPCILDDEQALVYYNAKIKTMQLDLCPDCVR
jgi:hypothetical protein